MQNCSLVERAAKDFSFCDFPTRSHLRKKADSANDCEYVLDRFANFANLYFADLADSLFHLFCKSLRCGV